MLFVKLLKVGVPKPEFKATIVIDILLSVPRVFCRDRYLAMSCHYTSNSAENNTHRSNRTNYGR